jgi:hypothetical protein
MTSLSRDQTGGIPPSSSGENTEGLVLPSEQSVSLGDTPISMLTTKKQLGNMLSDENKGSTTPTTLKINEKARQHATIARVALLQLEKAGLVKRYKVLSKDATTLQEIRVVFDPNLWTTDLVLSERSDNTDNT